jgi:hypothetical protein
MLPSRVIVASFKDWVDKKVRRHMMRARKRKGFGWKRWSRQWLYITLRLFNRYRVYRPTESCPSGRLGPALIASTSQLGEQSGNGHD